MLNWLKRHYDELAEQNWYSCDLPDEVMLRPCARQVKDQILLQNQHNLKKYIHQLGFKQDKDYNGKLVLKNNLPITPNQLPQSYAKKLVDRLSIPKHK